MKGTAAPVRQSSRPRAWPRPRSRRDGGVGGLPAPRTLPRRPAGRRRVRRDGARAAMARPRRKARRGRKMGNWVAGRGGCARAGLGSERGARPRTPAPGALMALWRSGALALNYSAGPLGGNRRRSSRPEPAGASFASLLLLACATSAGAKPAAIGRFIVHETSLNPQYVAQMAPKRRIRATQRPEWEGQRLH